MKKCGSCNTVQPLDSFPWKQRSKGTKQTYCKKCTRARAKQFYLKDKDKQIKRAKLNKTRYIERNKTYVRDLGLCCTNCGESRTHVLDFHHTDPASKDRTVADIIAAGLSLSRLKNEIDKCVPLCANCHRDYHFYHQ